MWYKNVDDNNVVGLYMAMTWITFLVSIFNVVVI
jgi:hypothetical protein